MNIGDLVVHKNLPNDTVGVALESKYDYSPPVRKTMVYVRWTSDFLWSGTHGWFLKESLRIISESR